MICLYAKPVFDLKVVFNGSSYDYSPYSGQISMNLNIDFFADSMRVHGLYVLGFNVFKKYFKNNNGDLDFFYIYVSDDSVKLYRNPNSEIATGVGDCCEVEVVNRNIKNGVTSFYTSISLLEIGGFRVFFMEKEKVNDIIYIRPFDENKRDFFEYLFGSMDEIFLDGYFWSEISVKYIDKIIQIKRYRDISTIGELGGEDYTGVCEEQVLDLRNLPLDKEVYESMVRDGILLDKPLKGYALMLASIVNKDNVSFVNKFMSYVYCVISRIKC